MTEGKEKEIIIEVSPMESDQFEINLVVDCEELDPAHEGNASYLVEKVPNIYERIDEEFIDIEQARTGKEFYEDDEVPLYSITSWRFA